MDERMNEDWTQLETQIDEMLTQLAPHLDAPATPQAIEHARLAARVALDEGILQNRELPVPPLIRERLRALVRREARSQPSSGAWIAWWQRHGRMLSACASAAMIAVCFGLIRHTGSAPGTNTLITNDALDRFVDAGESAYQGDPSSADIEDDLQDLEERIVAWPTDSDRLEDNLQQMQEMMDTLQLDATGNGTS